MDRERLECALKIINSQKGSALEIAFSSMVNLIIDNHNSSDSTNQTTSPQHESVKSSTEPQHESVESPTEMLKSRKTIKLTQIEDSLNYCDEDGFVYSTQPKPNKNLYYRCKYQNSLKCKARVIVENRNFEKATLTEEHCHLPSKEQLCKTKVDKKMDKICNEQKFVTTRVAYLKARKTINDNDVPYLPERKSYESFVQRRNRKFQPRIPHNFEEFEKYINDEEYKQRYTFDSRNKTFYRGIWKTKKDVSMIVFLSESAMEELQKMDMIEIMMDGTFRILPRHMKFSQLYIMSFIYKDRAYPFGFIFMEKRDTESYDCLFTNLISLWNVNVVSKVFKIMTDYESAVRKSIRKHFLNARLSGCFFHFVKALKKAAKKFGLSKDEKFVKPILEACCIALLPNDYIEEGFTYVKTQISGSSRWDRFCTYWERQWAKSNISVYGLKNRTNNFSETLNRSSNLLSGKAHQNIWHIIRTLRDVETEKTDELLQHVSGKMFKQEQSQRMIDLNKKILDAMLKFEETKDVGSFLQNVSYRSEFLLGDIHILRTFEAGTESGQVKDIGKFCFSCEYTEDGEEVIDEESEDEDFDEEIMIPNDFDEDCNFKRDNDKHRYADFFKRNDDILKAEATKSHPNLKRKAANSDGGTKRIRLF